MSRAAFRGFQVFCAFLITICLALGAWQVQRYYWKAELRAQANALAMAAPIDLPLETDTLLAHTPLELTGRFLVNKDIVIRGFARDGASGSRHYAPFELSDGRLVVLLRGWGPHSQEADLAVQDTSPQTIAGHWRTIRTHSSDRSLIQPVNAPEIGLWTHIDTAELAEHWGAPNLAMGGYVELRGPISAAQGAQIDPFALDLFDRHLEYIITWWALALTIAAIYLFVWRDQRRRRG